MNALRNCHEEQQMAASDRASLRKMVKEELREIFNDQDCRRRIREILQS